MLSDVGPGSGLPADRSSPTRVSEPENPDARSGHFAEIIRGGHGNRRRPGSPELVPSKDEHRRAGGDVAHQPVLHATRLGRLEVIGILADGDEVGRNPVERVVGRGIDGHIHAPAACRGAGNRGKSDDCRGDQPGPDNEGHQQLDEREPAIGGLEGRFHPDPAGW